MQGLGHADIRQYVELIVWIHLHWWVARVEQYQAESHIAAQAGSPCAPVGMMALHVTRQLQLAMPVTLQRAQLPFVFGS